jgi:hypothetical protein
MYPVHLRYLNEKGTTWANPWVILDLFWSEFRKFKTKLGLSHKVAWSHRGFKNAKEIYAASVIAAALSKQEGGDWWIHKPKSDPPDGVVGTLKKIEGRSEMHVREVEVVEHKGGDIFNTLKIKLLNKNYEPHTVLVCYISQGGTFDFVDISKKVSFFKTNLNNIFFIFPGFKFNDFSLNSFRTIACLQVKPVFSDIFIDLNNDYNSEKLKKQGSYFIFTGRGKGEIKPITLDNQPNYFGL